MNQLRISTLVVCCLTCLSSCGEKKLGTVETTFTSEEAKKVEMLGLDASLALQQNLGKQLKAALQSGGPESALHVCQQIAQPITEQTRVDMAAATVTRTSLRVRNPANVAGEQDRAVLRHWEELVADGEALPESKVIKMSAKDAIFYKPITTEQICLKCHGDPAGFSPELSGSLSELYPSDQAVNFSEGELRGAFRVRVELD